MFISQWQSVFESVLDHLGSLKWHTKIDFCVWLDVMRHFCVSIANIRINRDEQSDSVRQKKKTDSSFERAFVFVFILEFRLTSSALYDFEMPTLTVVYWTVMIRNNATHRMPIEVNWMCQCFLFQQGLRSFSHPWIGKVWPPNALLSNDTFNQILGDCQNDLHAFIFDCGLISLTFCWIQLCAGEVRVVSW